MKALLAIARSPTAAPPDDRGGVAVRALEPNGALAGYPGALLVVRADGGLLAANDAGEEIARDLMAPGAAGVRDEIAAAIEAGEARVAPLVLPRDGVDRALEITILPRGEDAALLLARDATLERQLRTTLIESRQRYQDLVTASSDFAWETDADGILSFVSPRGALGYPAGELVGRDPAGLVIGLDDGGAYLPFTARTPVEGVEFWCEARDGANACLVAAAVPVYDEHGEWSGARGVCHDVTEAREHAAESARRRRQEHALTHIVWLIREEVEPQRMLDAAAAATARATGAAGCIIFRAGAEEGRLDRAAEFGDVPVGAGPEALIGEMAIDRGHGADSRERLSDGSSLIACLTVYRQTVNGAICLMRAGDGPEWSEEERFILEAVAGQLGIALEQIAYQEELERISSTDALTGLANRRAFMRSLEICLARSVRTGRPGALVYVDLDNFKIINDTHGHERGDAALRGVSDLLIRSIRTYDLAARLGGDEFALWLEETDEDAAAERARALLAAAAPLAAESPDPARPLGLSIGVAIYKPGDGEKLDALIARADAAMYRIKHTSKGRFAVAEPAAREGE